MIKLQTAFEDQIFAPRFLSLSACLKAGDKQITGMNL
jgi:hypothetical protein